MKETKKKQEKAKVDYHFPAKGDIPAVTLKAETMAIALVKYRELVKQSPNKKSNE